MVVRNGLIEAVGAGLAPPPDAWVVEAPGLHVYPGLIDALSTWGMPPSAPRAAEPPARGPEDRPSNSSWLHAQDLVNPAERSIVSARNAGFTTAVVFPATGIFGGQGAALNLAGDQSGAMTVAGSLGLHHAFATRGFNNSVTSYVAPHASHSSPRASGLWQIGHSPTTYRSGKNIYSFSEYNCCDMRFSM